MKRQSSGKLREWAFNMAFVPPQRKDVPHSYGSDAVTKQLIFPHISYTNDKTIHHASHAHKRKQCSQPSKTYYASPYQQAISCCLRIENISITNIQAREKKKHRWAEWRWRNVANSQP